MERPKWHMICVSTAFAAALTAHRRLPRAAIPLAQPCTHRVCAFALSLQHPAAHSSVPVLPLLPHHRDTVTVSFRCPAEHTCGTRQSHEWGKNELYCLCPEENLHCEYSSAQQIRLLRWKTASPSWWSLKFLLMAMTPRTMTTSIHLLRPGESWEFAF